MRFKNVFSIIGPAMVGPSSSHTAGAVRLGRAARQLLGTQPDQAEIILYGSFAETFQGHGTDLALAAGLLDWDTDDPRIPDSLQIAAQWGAAIHFTTSMAPVAHPNTVKIVLSVQSERISMVGSSIGGGNIQVVHVDDFNVGFTGLYPTLIIGHLDRQGMIHEVTSLLRREEVNIGHMGTDRKERSGSAMTVIEVDGGWPGSLLREILDIPGVRRVSAVDLTRKEEAG